MTIQSDATFLAETLYHWIHVTFPVIDPGHQRMPSLHPFSKVLATCLAHGIRGDGRAFCQRRRHPTALPISFIFARHVFFGDLASQFTSSFIRSTPSSPAPFVYSNAVHHRLISSAFASLNAVCPFQCCRPRPNPPLSRPVMLVSLLRSIFLPVRLSQFRLSVLPQQRPSQPPLMGLPIPVAADAASIVDLARLSRV